MNTLSKLLFSIALVAFVGSSFSSTVVSQETPAALNFTMKSIQGKDVKLSKYAGKVVVLVNVASKCGFTPQYEQLQALHKEYAAKGVAVVGVPCNQFRGQEPGTDKEIAEFCKETYGVEFDMLAKVDVKGDKQCDLYKHLTALDVAPKGKGVVSWNFEKYILDKTGKPVGRFGSRTKPDSPEFMAVINKALGNAEAPAAGAGAVMPYSHVSDKSGKTYYLFSKEVPLKNSDKVQTIYYFAKDPNNKKGIPLVAVPEGKMVSETKTGMLVLKNKSAKKKK